MYTRSPGRLVGPGCQNHLRLNSCSRSSSPAPRSASRQRRPKSAPAAGPASSGASTSNASHRPARIVSPQSSEVAAPKDDYTPLHHAASRDDAIAVTMLLDRGADPTARTRIDNYGTPLEEAEQFGHGIGAAALRNWLTAHGRDAS